eukprot:TRINITY_DN25183_c0_g1_i6.p1 TRINITY_DN25183_c0_g1~~TRINITY_DN25183_c0_g1_i6.p1  ORF type:complete len:979 (-),score=204.76 TRINITY_DN25183_c0_g1_i6:152-3088(-)
MASRSTGDPESGPADSPSSSPAAEDKGKEKPVDASRKEEERPSLNADDQETSSEEEAEGQLHVTSGRIVTVQTEGKRKPGRHAAHFARVSSAPLPSSREYLLSSDEDVDFPAAPAIPPRVTKERESMEYYYEAGSLKMRRKENLPNWVTTGNAPKALPRKYQVDMADVAEPDGREGTLNIKVQRESELFRSRLDLALQESRKQPTAPLLAEEKLIYSAGRLIRQPLQDTKPKDKAFAVQRRSTLLSQTTSEAVSEGSRAEGAKAATPAPRIVLKDASNLLNTATPELSPDDMARIQRRVDDKIREAIAQGKPQLFGLQRWNEAATKLQAVWRGFTTRYAMRAYRKRWRLEQKRRRKEAAKRLQRAWRRRRVRIAGRLLLESTKREKLLQEYGVVGIALWSRADVTNWALQHKLDATSLKSAGLSGHLLLKLSDKMLREEIGVQSALHRAKLLARTRELIALAKRLSKEYRARVAPQELFISCPSRSLCQGWYRRLPGTARANGQPIWQHEERSYFVFSGRQGAWMVGDEQEQECKFKCDTGFLTSLKFHEGRMPHTVPEGEWRRFEETGWLRDSDVHVVGFRNLQAARRLAALRIQIEWRKRQREPGKGACGRRNAKLTNLFGQDGLLRQKVTELQHQQMESRRKATEERRELLRLDLVERKKVCATKIQTFVRVCIAQRVVQAMRDQAKAATVILPKVASYWAAKRIVLMKARLLHEERHRRAAAELQAAQLAEGRQDAATSIQAAQRGKIGRRKADRQREENQLHAEEDRRNEAATKVQALQRGRVGREKAAESRLAKRCRDAEELERRQHQAATVIEARQRGKLERRRSKQRIEDNRLDRERQQAAGKIQAVARGRQQRERYALMRDKKVEAATQIQGIFRRLRQTRRMRDRWQAILRKHSVDKLREQLTTQSKARDLAAKRFNLEVEAKQVAATKIQAAYRGMRDRRFCRRKRRAMAGQHSPQSPRSPATGSSR